MRLSAAILAVTLSWLTPAAVDGQARFGIEVHGSASRYAMGAMNDSLSSLNQSLGTRLDHIDDGRTWGAAFRLWAGRDLLLRLGWERLQAESDDDSGLTIDMTANAFTLGATWFPPSDGPLRIGFGLSAGEYFTAGGIDAPQASLQAAGHGFGVAPSLEAAFGIGPDFKLGLTGGYRWAAIRDLKFDEAESNLTADYSGPFLRLSVAVEWADE